MKLNGSLLKKTFGIFSSKRSRTIIFVSFFILFGVFICVQPALALQPPASSGGSTAKVAGTTLLVGAPAALAINALTSGGSGRLSEVVRSIIGWIVTFFVWVIGQLIALVVYILIAIANYNNFSNSAAIEKGWLITRDIANMFFVIIFLVIAFGTILGAQQYHYKKTLPRLLLMAILINFSKTIAGLVIDFGQVIMMTFVNGFSQAAGGNFLDVLKIRELREIRTQPGSEAAPIGGWDAVGGLLLALMVAIVSLVVMTIMTMVLVFRVVMLWLLVVMSPIAFFSAAVPEKSISKYYDQWWGEFTKYVIVGPTLAFFIWLSLAVVGDEGYTRETDALKSTAGLETGVQATASGVGGESVMIQYMIGLGMLVGGLMMTQQMGVMGSGMAGGAVSWGRRKGTGALKWGGKKAWRVASAPGRAIGGVAREQTDKVGGRIYGGLAKSGVPLVSGFAAKKVGQIREKRQKAEGEASGFAKTLNFDEAKAYLRSTDGIPLKSEAMKARRSQISKKILGGITTDNYSENQELAHKLTGGMQQRAKETGDLSHNDTAANFYSNMLNKLKFQDANAKNTAVAADIMKAIGGIAGSTTKEGDYFKAKTDFQQARPDMLEQKDMETTVGSMSALEVGSKVNVKAFDPKTSGGKQFLDYLNKDKKLWESVHKSAGAAKRAHMDKYLESSEVKVKDMAPAELKIALKADNIKVDSIDVGELEGGALAGQIAQHGTPELKSAVQAKYGKEYATGLSNNIDKIGRENPVGPGYNAPALAIGKEMLRTGAGVGKAFNVDESGAFKDSRDEVAFGTSVDERLGGDASNMLSLKPEEIQGRVQEIVKKAASNKDVLRKLTRSAKTDEQKDTLEVIIQEVYKEAGEGSDKDMMNFVERTRGVRDYVPKDLKIEVQEKASKK